MRRLDPSLGILDHALATLACLLAIYSISMSLSNLPMAFVLTGGTLFAATSGYALANLVRKTKLVNYDSYFWAVLGILAVGLVRVLNGILPGDGFPFELLAAGALCWILMIGNLFAWRDQTLLFLSLPCIAIFGLVGTFDTFQPATAMFFLFMITIAVLYARIHHRAMIERAVKAGVDEPALLRRGPWKWMAGPEWALASAMTIILFSFIGAPVLRISLKNVAGRVQVALPQQTSRNTANRAGEERSDVRVGTGPTRLSDQQIFKIRIDRPRYLRLSAFSTYTGSGWKASPVTLPTDSRLFDRRSSELQGSTGPNGGVPLWTRESPPPFEPIRRGEVIAFTFKEASGLFRNIATPGPIVEVKANEDDFSVQPQGWITLDQALEDDERITAYALVPTGQIQDKRAVLAQEIRPIGDLYLSKNKVPARVRDFAYRAVEGADSDYDKADAIKRAIESQVSYNIKAGRTPSGEDPVEYFLFESKEGYCDLFASAMAVMARSVGLPTRYVTGYIINEPTRDEEGFFTVRGQDYHAWCEIYFEDLGWVPFDPTEGAPSIDGGRRGGSGDGLAWFKSDAFKGTVAGVAVLALLAPILVLFRQRSRGGSGTTQRTASEVARLQNAYFRSIERFVGSPKRFSQTTREFVTTVGPRLGAAEPIAAGLVHDFEAALFSQQLPTSEKLSNMAAKVAELRAALGRMKKPRP
ncbi:MAG: transglutaminase domain-containing protein [Fimbriimonadaceae bacterium]